MSPGCCICVALGVLTQVVCAVPHDFVPVSSSQRVTSVALKRLGVRCRTAGNGQQGVDEIERDKPDLVLMDRHMPVMDGLKATQLIVERWPELPVVALTGNALADEVAEFLEAGATQVLTKPVKQEHLRRVCAMYGLIKADTGARQGSTAPA